jgi:cytochrome c oxidase assembly protein subunit 15
MGVALRTRTDWRLDLPEPTRRRLRIWLWAVASMVFAVLVVGGVTRLTHSGLSMVDWQPLVGVVPPLNEAQWAESFARYQQFPEYRQLRGATTLADYKFIFFWEYLHRLLARLIGVVVLGPLIVFWRSGALTRPLAVRVLALLGLGAMQGLLGWLMVRSGLVDRPSVSHYRLAAHLSLALVILGWCVWLMRDLSLGPVRARATAAGRRRTGLGLRIVGVLLALQIVYGALVAGLKAGFLLNTFPLMAGGLVPPAFLASGLAPVDLVQDPAAVQWVHRLLGTVLAAAVVVLFLRVRREHVDRTSRRLTAALLAAIAAQYLLGVLTLIHLVPLGLAAAHQAMAAVIVALWVAAVHHVRFVRDSG